MEKALNRFGIFLLAAAFVWSCVHVFSRSGIAPSDKPVIRFAHWQLEGGLREGFDEIAARYMELHPDVRIEQMAVPGKVYASWLRTAYAGGVMPDLIVLGDATDEDLVLHFRPITTHVTKPNPHNRGTPLEGIPWRETFVSGLAGSSGLNTLQDYYSAPVAELTIRMFLNDHAWREYFGDREQPTSFEEFMFICEEVERIAKEKGDTLMPLAGSRFTANILMEPLFQSQTQALWQTLNPLNDLNPPGTSPAALPFLPGLADLDMPEIHRGYQIMRDVGRFLQPGFLQLDRDEAILLFAQGRAMMLPTGAWDYGSILEQARFPVRIFHLPFPKPGEGLYGENVLGVQSEVGGGGATSFHLSARSPHPEIAVDFLKFMTSHQGNRIFSAISKWPPSVTGIEMTGETKAFAPILHGYPRGFGVAPIIFSSGDVYRLQGQALHRLFDRDGGVEPFLAALKAGFPRAVRDDITRDIDKRSGSIRRSDIMVAATRLSPQAPPGSEARALEQSRQSLLLQSQNFQETLRYRMEAHLSGRLLPKRVAHTVSEEGE